MNSILNSLSEAKDTLDKVINDKDLIQKINQSVEVLTLAFKNNKKVMSCGNGGSMCDAIHFAEELSGKFRQERPALAALSFSDPGHLSCVANDYGYDFVFSRMVEALGLEGDVLVGISTSGKSKNVIEAVKAAKTRGICTILLTGKDGGELKNLVDIPIIVPSMETDRIQEIHIKIIHGLIESIERNLFPENYA